MAKSGKGVMDPSIADLEKWVGYSLVSRADTKCQFPF